MAQGGAQERGELASTSPLSLKLTRKITTYCRHRLRERQRIPDLRLVFFLVKYSLVL